MEREAINQKIKKFYEFNDDDLFANKNGRLSQKQINDMRDRSKTIRMVGYLAGGFFTLLALCMGTLLLFVLMLNFLDKHGASVDISTLVTLVITFILFAGIGGYVLWRTTVRGKSTGVIRNISGPIQIRAVELSTTSKTGRKRYYKQYQMRIGDSSEFVLDDDMVSVVKEGDEYSVNFMDFQNGLEGLILSMEKL